MEQYAIQSVDRTFQVLETLSLHPQGLSLTTLAKETQLNKSTTYRLLASLMAHGYVIKDPQTNTYHISLKLYELGCRAVNSRGYISVVEPVLRKLTQESHETVHFVLREDDAVVYLYKEEPMQSLLSMGSHIGLRNPMYCTGVGKAILAFLPEGEQVRIAKSQTYVPFTPHTLITPESLLEDLAITRARGYALDVEEHELGIRCIAAPIRNSQGEAYAAISISAPASRFGLDTRRQELAQLICSAAEEISVRLMGTA